MIRMARIEIPVFQENPKDFLALASKKVYPLFLSGLASLTMVPALPMRAGFRVGMRLDQGHSTGGIHAPDVFHDGLCCRFAVAVWMRE
jgi:hypothetical protein